MATTSTPKSKVALPASNAGTTERNSTFVNKPARGWLHPDYLFAKDGINYNVRVSKILIYILLNTKITGNLYDNCLRSRPVDPNVVC